MSRSPILSLVFIIACAFQIESFSAEPGLSPQDAVKAMKFPDGFNVTLFAGEPDVVQPAAFEFDDRGRLWVAEFKSYPNWKPEGHDRILIFEDKNGTGHFDSVKVFWDKGNYLSGFTLGFGGVWVCCAPNLLFIPMKDGDDKPSGEPQVVLDGWASQGKHNVFNSLTWGPDGWLYGCDGITLPSNVGKPGAPDSERTFMHAGVWRYHPTKKIFEIVLSGTTNPWGIDYDDWGQMFICNTVIGHLWHVIPGMHTKRMFGDDINKYSYELLDQTADHIHWAGGSWTSSRGGKGPHDAAGGGHSHAGAMIYSGDNWPDKYRNTFFTLNTHGNRINNDILKRQGSGYVGLHGQDLLFANDPLFRGVAIKSGPDGGVFFCDWNQGGECHSGDLDTTGRIYKMTYGKTTPYAGDVSKLSDDELVKLQLHKNDWFVRHARRVLQERAANGTLSRETAPALLKMFVENPDVTRKLRAMWALNAIGAADEKFLTKQLDHADENIRCWAIRLIADNNFFLFFYTRGKFREMAQTDLSPMVRLHLASALQRVHDEIIFATIFSDLILHGEDNADHNLPLMYWYALEPHVTKLITAGRIAVGGMIPLVREFTARRLTEEQVNGAFSMIEEVIDWENQWKVDGKADLAAIHSAQIDVLKGMLAALKGQRDIAMPEDWKALGARLEASANADVRKLALKLAFIFGDPAALQKCLAMAADAKANLKDRESAIELLVQARAPKTSAVLLGLLNDADLRGAALRGLAVFDDAKTGEAIVSVYAQLTLAEKTDALFTLGSRAEYARALLGALKDKRIPKEDLNAFTLRYLENANVPELNQWIKANWGGTKPTPDALKASIAKYTKLIKDAGPQASDIKRGHEVFKKTCYNCHTLFGEGGKVGPDLTGSGRANLDYLMLNVVDPNAIVPYDYQVTVVKTKDGRMISGLERNDRDKTIDMITPNEVVTINKSEIASKKKIETSMMPEGILDTLKEQEIIDLVAFLQSNGKN
ncbi:MAG TPA: PVC-type heme-binding CxxCH protein [Planctomycetota bacterium]|nr:PVC-type heme-binding CxxCH protein [Planctomycetota bacterium]